MKALDSALASFNVQRQAYYGGTFVGNHVHRCLKVCTLSVYKLKGVCLPNSVPSHFKPDNSEKLCSAVTDVAQQHAPTHLPAAQTVADKFRRVFNLFGACHSIYDSAKLLEETTVDDLGKYNCCTNHTCT